MLAAGRHQAQMIPAHTTYIPARVHARTHACTHTHTHTHTHTPLTLHHPHTLPTHTHGPTHWPHTTHPAHPHHTHTLRCPLPGCVSRPLSLPHPLHPQAHPTCTHPCCPHGPTWHLYTPHPHHTPTPTQTHTAPYTTHKHHLRVPQTCHTPTPHPTHRHLPGSSPGGSREFKAETVSARIRKQLLN